MEGNIKATENKVIAKSEKPVWAKMKQSDLESLIIELAKKEKSPAKIGLLIRDLHGVPKSKTFGVKIAHLLRKNGIEYEDEKKIVEKKIEKLKFHIEKNKHDHTATRALTKQLWVLHNVDNRSK